LHLACGDCRRGFLSVSDDFTNELLTQLANAASQGRRQQAMPIIETPAQVMPLRTKNNDGG
jgi:hypothetical protein